MDDQFDVVVVGGGIAGGALATVLARKGVRVGVLERDVEPLDRVRGEYMAPWGVLELGRLGLRQVLDEAGAVYSKRIVPYDENQPGEAALPYALAFREIVPWVPDGLCMSHPGMCAALLAAAESAGATCLRGVDHVEVVPGAAPAVAFAQAAERRRWTARLVIGADGRNSRLRRQLGIAMQADAPHNLLGGVLVDRVPDWPQDMAAIGTEDRVHFLVTPQGGGRVRLYLCFAFEDRALFTGSERERRVIDTFARLRCLPQAAMIAEGRAIGRFSAYSNEDHWSDDPTAPGVVLIGDAAGHNDPVIGQGLSIALRDVRLVAEIILAGGRDRASFRSYVEERRERMRRLRIVAHLTARLRVEFGEEARQRRRRVGARMRADPLRSPMPATLIGPEKLPAVNFEQRTIEALLAD